eukprot:1176900-Rhodomonas_salina.4
MSSLLAVAKGCAVLTCEMVRPGDALGMLGAVLLHGTDEEVVHKIAGDEPRHSVSPMRVRRSMQLIWKRGRIRLAWVVVSGCSVHRQRSTRVPAVEARALQRKWGARGARTTPAHRLAGLPPT